MNSLFNKLLNNIKNNIKNNQTLQVFIIILILFLFFYILYKFIRNQYRFREGIDLTPTSQTSQAINTCYSNINSGICNKQISSLQCIAKAANNGNFVIYNSSGNPVWNSNSGIANPIPPYTTIIGSDGNFVLKDGINNTVWQTNTGNNPGAGGPYYAMVPEDDCSLKLYDKNGTIYWSSNPSFEIQQLYDDASYNRWNISNQLSAISSFNTSPLFFIPSIAYIYAQDALTNIQNDYNRAVIFNNNSSNNSTIQGINQLNTDAQNDANSINNILNDSKSVFIKQGCGQGQNYSLDQNGNCPNTSYRLANIYPSNIVAYYAYQDGYLVSYNNDAALKAQALALKLSDYARQYATKASEQNTIAQGATDNTTAENAVALAQQYANLSNSYYEKIKTQKDYVNNLANESEKANTQLNTINNNFLTARQNFLNDTPIPPQASWLKGLSNFNDPYIAPPTPSPSPTPIDNSAIKSYSSFPNTSYFDWIKKETYGSNLSSFGPNYCAGECNKINNCNSFAYRPEGNNMSCFYYNLPNNAYPFYDEGVTYYYKGTAPTNGKATPIDNSTNSYYAGP
jgi:hypothetical protein